MKSTITELADIEMAMGMLSRRGFSASAVALMAGTRAFGAGQPDPFAYTGSDRRKFLEAGARREGRLMFYSSLIPNLGLKAIVDGFKGKYPFVTIESWRGTEGNIAQKMLAELRSGTTGAPSRRLSRRSAQCCIKRTRSAQ